MERSMQHAFRLRLAGMMWAGSEKSAHAVASARRSLGMLDHASPDFRIQTPVWHLLVGDAVVAVTERKVDLLSGHYYEIQAVQGRVVAFECRSAVTVVLDIVAGDLDGWLLEDTHENPVRPGQRLGFQLDYDALVWRKAWQSEHHRQQRVLEQTERRLYSGAA